MNDSKNQDDLRLKQMLEEATAADSSIAGPADLEPGDSLGSDPETASLREAWLAFGQLIRAADDSLPAMPRIATHKPRAATADSPHDNLPSARPAPQVAERGSRRWIGLAAATAAALFVTLTFAWWIRRDGKQDNNIPSLAQTVTPQQPATKTSAPSTVAKQAQPKAAVAQAEKATNKQPKAGTTIPSTWDDSLETQIVLVSKQISDVERNWQHHVDDLDLVQYRIDEVTDSLQNDKL